MSPIEYRLDEQVAVVTMKSGENRFNTEFLEAFEGLLDDIEYRTEATALLVGSAHEKIWSNGLDLEWLQSESARDPDAAARISRAPDAVSAAPVDLPPDHHCRHQRPRLCRGSDHGLRL